jgi:hypothetical protein
MNGAAAGANSELRWLELRRRSIGRGGCWGKWPLEAFTTSGRAVGFGSRAASAKRRKLCNGELTKTLMLLELCEFCCAGTAQPNDDGLRCRKRGLSTFGAEGMEEPEAPRVGCSSAREWRQPGRGVPKGPTRPGRDHGLFSAPKVRCAATRGCCKRVKGAPYEAETRGAACKRVLAVRRHTGGLYDAGSYYYTLVKCLKPFVRNGKGVIEADDHVQGPPINSEPLVMKQTRCNEKRAPKAPTSLTAFGLLSVSLFPCFLLVEVIT